jgi:hypothetical protein
MPNINDKVKILKNKSRGRAQIGKIGTIINGYYDDDDEEILYTIKFTDSSDKVWRENDYTEDMFEIIEKASSKNMKNFCVMYGSINKKAQYYKKQEEKFRREIIETGNMVIGKMNKIIKKYDLDWSVFVNSSKAPIFPNLLNLEYGYRSVEHLSKVDNHGVTFTVRTYEWDDRDGDTINVSTTFTFEQLNDVQAKWFEEVAIELSNDEKAKEELNEYKRLKDYIDGGKAEEDLREISEKIKEAKEKYNKLKEKYEAEN